MDKWIPYIITSIPSLLVGYLVGYWNYGLANRRDSKERRRLFRVGICNISTNLFTRPNVVLLDAYRASILEVVKKCNGVKYDVVFGRRRAFARAQAAYRSFIDEQVNPLKRKEFKSPNPCSADLAKAWESSRAMLQVALNQVEKSGRDWL